MEMRFIIPVVAAILICAGTVAALSCTGAKPQQIIELSYSNFFPPTHLNSVLAEKFCQEIERRTNGRVRITHYAGGSLTPAAGVYDGVVRGISDIGMSCLAYTMGRFPASEIVDLPHGYPNGWVATKVANDFYRKFKPKEFDDVQVLYFHAHGPGVLFTTKKPVRKLEDLRGLVIRSTGVGAKIMEALGAKGYGASQAEAYELMSKGTIDGSFTPREVLKGWKQAEVVRYVTLCYDVGNTTDMFVVINKTKWETLPSDVKKVFMDVSEEWVDKHGMVWTYYDKVALDYFLTFPDRQLIELPADEMARWVKAVQPLIAEYIQQKAAMGLPAREYHDYLVERVKYWSERAPSEAFCIEWVEKELTVK